MNSLQRIAQLEKRIAYIKYLKVINQYTGKKLTQFMRMFNRLEEQKMCEKTKANSFTVREAAIMAFYAK